MSTNIAIATTVEDRLTELGGISPSRLRLNPPLGLATEADLIAANEMGNKTLVELVDGCLVEKAMGYEASVVAAAIVRILGNFVSIHRLGLVSGDDGFFRLLDSTRGPDVAFVALDRLPTGVLEAKTLGRSSHWLCRILVRLVPNLGLHSIGSEQMLALHGPSKSAS